LAEKHALESRAAEERRTLERGLERKQADYDLLAKEAARISLNTRAGPTRTKEAPRQSLKTEREVDSNADKGAKQSSKSDRPKRETARLTVAAARPPTPDLYGAAPGYSDEEGDDNASDGDDDVTKSKQRLHEEEDKKLRRSSTEKVDPVSHPISPVGVMETITPRGANLHPRPMINDAAVAPKPFLGTSGQPAVAWIAYFLRYCDFKKASDEERQNTFCLLQRDSAAEWLETLSAEESADFESLVKAFKGAFCPSPELIWLEESQVWKHDQKVNETVEEFVTRVRRAGRRANMTDASLNNAIIQGLRSPIRMAVLQQGIKGLKETIHAAKIAESSLVADPATALLIESFKNQTAQMEAMVSKVAAVAQMQAAQAPVSPTEAKATTEQSGEPPVSGGGGQRGGQRGNWRGGGRQRRNTPQNQQRANYAQQQQYAPAPGTYNESQPQYQQQQGYAQPPPPQQQAWNGGEQQNYAPPAGHGGAPAGYEPQNQQYRPAAGHGGGGPGPQQTRVGGGTCPNCGFDEHGPQQFCPARTQKCHNCQKVGHFSRVCRQGQNRGQAI